MFEKIQDIWKNERGNENLTPMDEIFYRDMRELLKTRNIKTKKEMTLTNKPFFNARPTW